MAVGSVQLADESAGYTVEDKTGFVTGDRSEASTVRRVTGAVDEIAMFLDSL